MTGKHTHKELEQRIQILEKASIKNEPVEEQPQSQTFGIFNFLPKPTFIIDNEVKVVFWKKDMEAITGIKASDMLGKYNYEYALPFYG